MAERKKFARGSVEVISNEQVAAEHYCLVLGDEEMARATSPGQFFQVRLKGEGAPFLPRPFSLYDWHTDDSGRRTAIKLLYKVVGKGTSALARLKGGGDVAVTGPLGNGFGPPQIGKRHIIAAGGIGIAPFMALARRYIEDGVSPGDIHLLYGARCQSLLVTHDEFAKMGVNVEVIADDGSCGARGTVLDLVKKHTANMRGEEYVIYSSGPTPMLNALVAYCQAKGLNAEVSLEARMVCGIGVCNSCAVRVKSDKAADGWDYKLVCRDGPVFSASMLYIE